LSRKDGRFIKEGRKEVIKEGSLSVGIFPYNIFSQQGYISTQYSASRDIFVQNIPKYAWSSILSPTPRTSLKKRHIEIWLTFSIPKTTFSFGYK
jgi:hypothetical protein